MDTVDWRNAVLNAVHNGEVVGQRGLGAPAFWTFVREALTGPASEDVVCKHFLLAPRDGGDGAPQDALMLAAAAGAALVVGGMPLSRGPAAAVTAVFATQRWALGNVRGLAAAADLAAKESLTRKGSSLRKRVPFSLLDVAQMLHHFEGYIGLRARSGKIQMQPQALPKEDWPEGWQSRLACMESALGASNDGIAACRALPLDKRRDGAKCGILPSSKQGIDDALESDAALRQSSYGPCDARRAESCTVVATDTRARLRPPPTCSFTRPSFAALAAKSPSQASRRDASRAKVPLSKELCRTRKQGKHSGTEWSAEQPETKQLPAKSTSSKEIASAEKRGLPSGSGKMSAKPNAKRSRGDRTCGSKIAVETPAVGELAVTALAAEATVTDVLQAKALATAADAAATASDPAAAALVDVPPVVATLHASVPRIFAKGQLGWCRGFGPLWPVRIEAVELDDDPKPYLVKFFGDKRVAWVCEAKLQGWRASTPWAIATPGRLGLLLKNAIAEASAASQVGA